MSKSGVQQARLLSATDDDDSSTIIPLTRFEYSKDRIDDVTEMQPLWEFRVNKIYLYITQ